MTLAKTATLRQLATFQAVARLGSASLAADELHLSQSAISIQIASLETAAGTPLVLRTGRGVRLTEAGELLLNYADRLLALSTEASDEMATFLGAFSGTLRLGSVTTSEYWLPRLLVTFFNENPRVKLKLHVANRDEIVRSLAAQEIDLAVMGQPPDELKVVAASFAKIRWHLAVRDFIKDYIPINGFNRFQIKHFAFLCAKHMHQLAERTTIDYTYIDVTTMFIAILLHFLVYSII